MKTLSGPVYSQKPSDTKHHFLEGQVNLKKLEYKFFRIKKYFFLSSQYGPPQASGDRAKVQKQAELVSK